MWRPCYLKISCTLWLVEKHALSRYKAQLWSTLTSFSSFLFKMDPGIPNVSLQFDELQEQLNNVQEDELFASIDREASCSEMEEKNPEQWVRKEHGGEDQVRWVFHGGNLQYCVKIWSEAYKTMHKMGCPAVWRLVWVCISMLLSQLEILIRFKLMLCLQICAFLQKKADPI